MRLVFSDPDSIAMKKRFLILGGRPVQWDVLTALLRKTEPVTAKILAGCSSPASVRKHLCKLEAMGLSVRTGKEKTETLWQATELARQGMGSKPNRGWDREQG